MYQRIQKFNKKWQNKNGIFQWSNIKRNFILFRCSLDQFLCWRRHISCRSKWFVRRQSKIENLGKNLRSMVEKCNIHGIKNVFISGLVYKTRIGLPVLQKTHGMIVHLCNKLGICYVDNWNIRRKYLWKDGLHLVESAKVVLANNFLSSLSKCFLIHIDHLGLFT